MYSIYQNISKSLSLSVKDIFYFVEAWLDAIRDFVGKFGDFVLLLVVVDEVDRQAHNNEDHQESTDDWNEHTNGAVAATGNNSNRMKKWHYYFHMTN